MNRHQVTKLKPTSHNFDHLLMIQRLEANYSQVDLLLRMPIQPS